jgi:hypothetical protein
MQPRPHAQPRLDALANVGEILHRNSAPAEALDPVTAFLLVTWVDVTHMWPLLARDLAETLSGAPGAVGRKTATQGKIAITFVTKLPAAPNLARIRRSDVVFSDVRSKDGAERFEFDLLLQTDVKQPLVRGSKCTQARRKLISETGSCFGILPFDCAEREAPVTLRRTLPHICNRSGVSARRR